MHTPHFSMAFVLFAASAKVLMQEVEQKTCAPPDNFGSLPVYAQVELTDLWSTYTPGTSCSKELAIQEDVLNVVRTFSKDFVEKGTTFSNSVRRSIVPAASTPPDDDYDEDPPTTSFPILLQGDTQTYRKKPSKAFHFDEATIDDIATMRFNTAQHATFLHSVAPEVRRKFERIWNDADIPSEALRNLKIQTLAVSLLNGKQLEEYNRWATKRRYVLKAREQELRRLSPDAKRALRRISNQYRDDEKIPVPPSVKRELRNFVLAFNRRRSKALH